MVNTHVLVCYNIISYIMIKFYMYETMDMVGLRLHNGPSVKYNTS